MRTQIDTVIDIQKKFRSGKSSILILSCGCCCWLLLFFLSYFRFLFHFGSENRSELKLFHTIESEYVSEWYVIFIGRKGKTTEKNIETNLLPPDNTLSRCVWVAFFSIPKRESVPVRECVLCNNFQWIYFTCLAC